jgi:hypothetical protein
MVRIFLPNAVLVRNWGQCAGKIRQNPKSEPVTPKADQKHEKIFYRCPHPKAEQNYLASKICYN